MCTQYKICSSDDKVERMFAPQLLYEHCTFFVREEKWKRAKKATNISNADEKTRNIDDFCGFAIATEYTYTY